MADATTPVCDCKAGYEGKYCELNINECDSVPCQNNGSCTDLIADYVCECSGTGFEGKICEIDIDECLTENISCGGLGTCINTRGSYKWDEIEVSKVIYLLTFTFFRCQCNEGMCGPDCNLFDPCQESEPCMNGAFCIETCSTFSDYKCQCIEGYAGKNCSEVVRYY